MNGGEIAERIGKTYKGKLNIDHNKVAAACDDVLAKASAFTAPELLGSEVMERAYGIIFADEHNRQLIEYEERRLAGIAGNVQRKYDFAAREMDVKRDFPRTKVNWESICGDGASYVSSEDTIYVSVPLALSDDVQFIEDCLAEEWIHGLSFWKAPKAFMFRPPEPEKLSIMSCTPFYVLEGIPGLYIPNMRVDHDALVREIGAAQDRKGERMKVLKSPHKLGRAMMDAIASKFGRPTALGTLDRAHDTDYIVQLYFGSREPAKRIF